MIAYNNPEVKLMDNPVGVDAAIQSVQLVVRAKCNWIQTVFGRAFKQEAHRVIADQSGRKREYYPECYQNDYEPINVMPNDNLAASVFFYISDPRRSVDYETFELNNYTGSASLIVWARMDMVFGTNIDQRRTEELIRSVTDALRVCPAVKVTSVYESWENVYDNYTVLEQYRQYMKPPNTAFRIDFDLTYMEECL